MPHGTITLDPGVPPRAFYTLREKGENPLDSNLTELLAAESVDRGFMNHNDWLAHCLRYQHVATHVAKGKIRRLLDVGCGQLQLPYYLYRNRVPPVADYWGLDLRAVPKWLEPANWKAPLHLVRADFVLDAGLIDQLPGFGGPGSFDAAVFMEALEHIPRANGAQAMVNIFTWLRPGGLLFFSTPNAGVSDSTAANHTDASGHSREWSYPDKVRLLEEVGFTIRDAFGTFAGVRRLPDIAAEHPALAAMRRYLSTSMYTALVAAAYPAEANNCLFVAQRPA